MTILGFGGGLMCIPGSKTILDCTQPGATIEGMLLALLSVSAPLIIVILIVILLRRFFRER